MTRLLSALAIAIPALSLMPNSASAWYCKAVARDGHYGWASYANRRASIENALRECANRSRYPLSCHIVNCIPD